jgi:hypothetical protein
VERPTLEKIGSYVTSGLGNQKVINTMQFRLAYAIETTLTTRMVFGILDMNY